VKHTVTKAVDWIVDTIHRPQKVLFICLALILMSLVFDGTLIKIWRLNKNIKNFETESMKLSTDIHAVNKQIRQAHDPDFLEREARDRFDLVNEGDLIFVFSNDKEVKATR